MEVGSERSTLQLRADGNTAFGIFKAVDSQASTRTTTINGADIQIEARGVTHASGINLENQLTENAESSSQRLILGGDGSQITIHAEATAEDGEAYGMRTLYANSNIEVNAEKLTVTAIGNEAVGLTSMIGHLKETDATSSIVINAAQTTIRAQGEEWSAAIQTTSQGTVEINGSLDAEAENVIMARGESAVSINKANDPHATVRLKGDINYNTTDDSSSAADILINLTNAESSWEGSVIRTFATQPSEENFDKTDVKLSLSNGAQWTSGLVESTEKLAALSLDELTLEGGVVNVAHGAAQVVAVDELKGAGGQVNVTTKKTDGQFDAGSLSIGSVVQKDAALTVTYDGITADQIEDADAELAELQKKIEVGGEAGKGIAMTQVVEQGEIAGAITTVVDEEGNRVSQTQEANTKLTAFSSVAAIAAVNWRHETDSLSKRMGELRDSPNGIGTWVRAYGSELEYGAQSVTSKNSTLQIGGDATIGDWKVGLMGNYTDGDVSYDGGEADTETYGFGVYGTWFVPCGAYVDLMAKYSRLNNDFTLENMKGTAENDAFAIGAEVGYRLPIGTLAFAEPQFGLTYGRILGDDFVTANGVRVAQDDYESLIGRIGIRTGLKFPKDRGTLYVRVSALHDFQGEMASVASLAKDASVRENLREDLGGTWVEYGVGANFGLTNRTYAHVDLERTTGGEVREAFRWNVGLRHVW